MEISQYISSLKKELKNHFQIDYLLNKKFKANWFNFVWQSAAVGLITTFSIYIFSIMGLVILAGVASTFCLIFTIPGNRVARIRNIMGSYIIVIVIGSLCYYISPTPAGKGLGLAVAAFLMDITDTEHPPAAGIMLGLTNSASSRILLKGIGFVIAVSVLASFLKYYLSPYMMSLIPEGSFRAPEQEKRESLE